MALNSDEQELYDWLRSSLPGWFFASDDAPGELWEAVAKALNLVRQQVDSWLEALYILSAEGVWLNQHARDRDTFRQGSETDETLADRLRSIEDAVTPAAVELAVNKVLLAQGVPSLVTVPRGGWRMNWAVEDSCSGVVSIPEGYYTLQALLTEVQTQFFDPESPATAERVIVTYDAAGVVTFDSSLADDDLSLTWVHADFRAALGFDADVSGVTSATGDDPADGWNSCAMVELRRDRGFMQVYTPPGGTGDAYTKSGDLVTLTDAAAAFDGAMVPPVRRYAWLTPRARVLSTGGSTTPANDQVDASVVDVGDDSLSFYNPAGAAEAYTGTWQVDNAQDGFRKAYLSRGYRMTRHFTTDPALVDLPRRGAAGFVVILPYGTTEATASGVREALRAKKAGGIVAYVERRANP